MKRIKVQDLRVSDYMSTDLVTGAPDDTIGDLLGKPPQIDCLAGENLLAPVGN